MIGRISGGFSRHWKKSPAVFQALEKRGGGQAARSRDVQERRSGALSKVCGRSDRTACALFLSGGPCGAAARLAASSAATAFFLFARAPTRSPPKAGGKSAAERREVGSVFGECPEGGGPPLFTRAVQARVTAEGGPARGGSEGTRPACRASTGAAQRRPCSEPRSAARSRSTAQRAVRGAARRGSAEPGAWSERRVSAAR